MAERVKVRREVAGRRGKAVTTISGVPLDDAGLRELAGRLKKRCGVGGSAKGGVIELQGDHRDAVVEVLRGEGYDVVLAGGGATATSPASAKGGTISMRSPLQKRPGSYQLAGRRLGSRPMCW